jgi:hypothetical protein
MLNYQRVLYSYGNDALFFAGQFKQNGPTIYTRWKALCIGERGTSICWQSTGMTKSYEQSTSTSQSGWCFTRLREISSVSFLQFPPFGRHFWPHLRSYSFIYFVSPSIFRLSLSYVILPDESQRVSSFCCFTPPVSIQPKKQALFHPIPLPYLQAIFHCRVPFCFPPGSAPESTSRGRALWAVSWTSWRAAPAPWCEKQAAPWHRAATHRWVFGDHPTTVKTTS